MPNPKLSTDAEERRRQVMRASSSFCKDDVDDVSELEPKVIVALTRLQKGGKLRDRSRGFEKKEIVDYLKRHYCYLDGDIESQVITALLSCMKCGIICCMKNGKFRLLGHSSRNMVSNCLTRPSHGNYCSCLKVLKKAFKNPVNMCCTLNTITQKQTKVRSQRENSKRKSESQTKPRSNSRRKSVSQPKVQPMPADMSRCQALRKVRHCVQTAEKILRKTKKPKTNGNVRHRKRTCNYCLNVHPRSKSNCELCYPPGFSYGIPLDKFSPRDAFD